MCIRDRLGAEPTASFDPPGLVFFDLDGVRSVSYTHLDVYKRQVVPRERSQELNKDPTGKVASTNDEQLLHRAILPPRD